MAVRIYALAKELKLDSKELVDVCTNAGLPGKGSALASLTDEEAERIRQFVKGSSGKPKASTATAPTPQRPSEPGRTGKMPVIVTPKPAPVRSTTSAPETAGPADAEEQPIAASAEPKTVAPRAPGPLAAALRRDEYVGPGAKGKVPMVG
ncbi:MAG: translation initiation factor IF-2 N-terminal domain-containing protein, partial [Pirellulales bacterium]